MVDDIAIEAWLAIWRLSLEYCRLLDSQQLESWIELFCDDGTYQCISKENRDKSLPLSLIRCEGRAGLKDRVVAIEDMFVFKPRTMRHVVSGPVILNTEYELQVSARSSFAIFESIGQEMGKLYATGEYDDLIRFVGNVPRFVHRIAVYDSPLLLSDAVFPM